VSSTTAGRCGGLRNASRSATPPPHAGQTATGYTEPPRCRTAPAARTHQPGRPPAAVEEQVVRLRREHRIGPVRLAARTGVAASTADRILHRHHLPALDDHSRLAYTELPGEKAATCAAFLQRAAAWFSARGVSIKRVLTDNAWAYTKNTWRDTCHDLDISPRWTRPWRPQTNCEDLQALFRSV
jgi:transposase InsO family protein